ncbi:hypothetical protein SLE2022_389600 [Rubroshorea leprosula]
MESCIKHYLLVFFYLICLSFFVAAVEAVTKPRPFNNKVSAVLVFGDSTVDSGNNNYVNTLFRGNFPPYGRDFRGQNPTGRFSNGRLTPDFIASYAGVKDFVPPYLDPTLTTKELLTGVSFASAGSGFDPLTPELSSVISMPDQLEYFREYKKKLVLAIGKKRTEEHIKRAVFLVGAGTNDFVVNYFTLPVRRKTYSVTDFEKFILQLVTDFIQSLWEEGARRIAVSGLPPMGCLPVVITLYSNDAIFNRGCVGRYSHVAMEYNKKLQNELNFMHHNLANQGAKIVYFDIFNPLVYLIQGPGKSEFDDVSHGCCGTGFLEAGFLCNPKSYVCSDASKYVFFDSIHPTEKTYFRVFEAGRGVIDLLIKD